MKCTNCNNEIAENTKFCKFCGTPVKKEEKPLVCPFCNAQVKIGASFCTSCGKKLEAQNAVSTPKAQAAAPQPVYTPQPTYVSPQKKKSAGLYVALGVLTALLIGVIIFIVIIMQKDNKNTDIPKAEKPVAAEENGIMLDVDDVDSEVTEATYTLSGTAAVSGKEAVLSIDGEEIRTIYPDDGKVHWSEEVSLEEGLNSFDIRLRDDGANYKIVTVRISYTAPEEGEEYLFPSDSEYITDSDLEGKTKEEVALIRNEIYARHGYVFNTEAYQEYFAQKEWYQPDPGFSEAQLNEIELANKDFLVEYEESRGWR